MRTGRQRSRAGSQRLLARTHGGATAHAVSYELPLRYKGVRHSEKKRRIACEAAEQVSEGMAVGLTGGTTATEVARALADRQKLTIVTNALNIASGLAVRPGIKLIATGGVVRSQSYELSGPIAECASPWQGTGEETPAPAEGKQHGARRSGEEAFGEQERANDDHRGS
jgi:DeoR family transcriptional regulator, aga operon transcriptional repressor